VVASNAVNIMMVALVVHVVLFLSLIVFPVTDVPDSRPRDSSRLVVARSSLATANTP